MSQPKISTEDLARGIALQREARASVALDGETHYVGDECPGGHRPTFEDRLAESLDYSLCELCGKRTRERRVKTTDGRLVCPSCHATARIVELEAQLAEAAALIDDIDREWARPNGPPALEDRISAFLARHPQAKP